MKRILVVALVLLLIVVFFAITAHAACLVEQMQQKATNHAGWVEEVNIPPPILNVSLEDLGTDKIDKSQSSVSLNDRLKTFQIAVDISPVDVMAISQA